MILRGDHQESDKNWLGGSYPALKSKPMVPGDRSLIDVGYNYNMQKVIYLIYKEYTGSKKAGITYLYK